MPAPRKLNWEVVIVEDNSPDGTLEIAQQLQKVYGQAHIQILPRKGKLGLGSAYMDGLKLANGDYVVIMDADMSHHPNPWHWFGQWASGIWRQSVSPSGAATPSQYAASSPASEDAKLEKHSCQYERHISRHILMPPRGLPRYLPRSPLPRSAL